MDAPGDGLAVDGAKLTSRANPSSYTRATASPEFASPTAVRSGDQHTLARASDDDDEAGVEALQSSMELSLRVARDGTQRQADGLNFAALAETLSGGKNSYAVGLTLEVLRLMEQPGNGATLVVRTTIVPGTWLVSAIAPMVFKATVSAGFNTPATCDHCFGLGFCVHLAAVNVLSGATVCRVPEGWSPQTTLIAENTRRAFHTPGSKEPRPHREYAARTIGSAYGPLSHLPRDLPELVTHLAQHEGVKRALQADTFIVQSVHRPAVHHTVISNVCTFHTARSQACVCVLAVQAFSEQAGAALDDRAQKGTSGCLPGMHR